ncbi:MAG: DUF1015 domain-containing protein [Acidobacteria bacterium]|nr:DUF1015 domain-containing protein [Acidobacteriota bacterium]
MVRIKPFKGVRPTRELAEKVASFPYDVLNSEEARKLASNNPYSFLRVVKPEITLDPSIDLYDDSVYRAARENLEKLIKEGTLVQDGENHLYVYRQKMGNHVQTGLVGCASADDYMADRIKKHELTRADKEKDRTMHVYTTNANAGPVFLTYKAVNEIDSIIERVTESKPEYDFVSDDGIGHIFWVIWDNDIIKRLESLFAEMSAVYVADGHHRSASGASVRDWRKRDNPNHTGEEEYNFFLAVYFPHNQLAIMPYNRVVKDLNGLTKEQYLGKVAEKFNVEKSGEKEPGYPTNVSMYLDGEWYTLTAKEGTYPKDDPVHSLDVSILQENLLVPVLDIGDPRTDKRIDFIGGIRGTKELERLVDSGKFVVAFSMYATSIEQLIAIADAGKTMPPKSTWFEPKLRSGLIVHMLD